MLPCRTFSPQRFFPEQAFALILFKDYCFVENKKLLFDAVFLLFGHRRVCPTRICLRKSNKNVFFDVKLIFYLKNR